ncbi:uncharacterized protein LOC143036447 isoform X3 [Oratosquilla oratoria]|uniref:uncharacterized protein LOC143036447 isoform X3 n=1 Tax=Oratosquilla oratoria TaxID=337810 RepID=UPI003F75CD13
MDTGSSFNFGDVLKRLSIVNEDFMHPSPLLDALMNKEAERESSSPAQLQDAPSLESVHGGSIPFSFGLRSPSKVSPLRGRTMKEYEEQLDNLKKENFSLKLRIYFLEDRIGQKVDKEDREELYKTNIELKVETEALKRELYDKQELVRQASNALTALDQQYQEQVAQLNDAHQQENQALQERIEGLQKEIEDYETSCQERDSSHQSELSRLCGLAFSDDKKGDDQNSHIEDGFIPGNSTLPCPPTALPLHLQGNKRTRPTTLRLNKKTKEANPKAPSALQGVFSLPPESPQQPELEALQERVAELEKELVVKEETKQIIEGDVVNLRKELECKEEEVAELRTVMDTKEEELQEMVQQLEDHRAQLLEKDQQIQQLQEDLIKMEPEIEVKVQEIVERDRIIEEKMEQIDKQNKILVEIQITLDEKQKQIAELEATVSEKAAKLKEIEEAFNESCQCVQRTIETVATRDKEIAALKKDVKRREKRIRDLINELKEALDMLKKAKWEKETSGEDSVKEMAEEENERLWAELEGRKKEMANLTKQHEQALQDAKAQAVLLQDQLKENQEQLSKAQDKLKALKQEQELAADEHGQKMKEKAEKLAKLEEEVQGIKGDLASREAQLESQQQIVQGLKDELASAKDLLKEKKGEMDAMNDELKKKNADIQDIINKELWDRNREIEKLQNKLSSLMTEKRNEIDTLKDDLEARNSDIKRLETRLNILLEESKEEPKKPVPESQISTDKPDCQKINDASSRTEANHNTSNNNSTSIDTGSKTTSKTICHTVKTHEVVMTPMVNLDKVGDNVATVQLLYEEVNKIRGEAQALRMERKILSDKLSHLQKVNDRLGQSSSEEDSKKIGKEMEKLRKQLEESKEENLEQVKKHSEATTDFRSQILTLKEELKLAKRKINRQLTEVNVRKYHDAIKRYRQEVLSLRKRLVDSHHACDLLRTRLEELADFLERILEMDKKGLINLSELSPKQIKSLHKTLNESRALSQSLSQSLMIGMDSTLGINADETALGTSFNFISSCNVLQEESLSEPLDMTHNPHLTCDSSKSRLSHNPRELHLTHDSLNLSQEALNMMDSTFPLDSTSPSYQAIVSQLNEQIDLKTKEIDDIAESVFTLSSQLEDKNRVVEEQQGLIKELQNHVEELKEELHKRGLEGKPCHQHKASLSGEDWNKEGHDVHKCESFHNLSNPLAVLSESTVRALSPEGKLLSQHDSCSSQELRKSSSTFSDTLPPPQSIQSSRNSQEIVFEDAESSKTQSPEMEASVTTERELELCHHSDHSNISAIKSAYSTDVAIKANSANLGYLDTSIGIDQCVEGPASLWGVAASAATPHHQPPPTWSLVSPSESEAWSEPDRNVSLARIGLDVCALGASPSAMERSSTSRSRQQQQQRLSSIVHLSSESDPPCLEDGAKPSGKRRSEMAELRRVTAKLRALEQLNETLHAELSIYQTLSKHTREGRVSSSSGGGTGNAGDVGTPSVRPPTSDKSVATQPGQTADAAVGEEGLGVLVPMGLLEEIKALRSKLEEAIANNDHLRDQLEAALAQQDNECLLQQVQPMNKILQEELQRTQIVAESFQEKLSHSQRQLNETQERFAQQKLLLEELAAENECVRSQTEEAKEALQRKEAEIVKQTEQLQTLEARLAECQERAVEQDHVISDLLSKLTKAQQQEQDNQDQVSRIKALEEQLQTSEARVLSANKEKLALIGERTRLQAQLASLTTHARLLHDDKEAEHVSQSSERAALVQQLETGRNKCASLQHERQQLVADKHRLEKERQILQEELASLKSRADHMLAREAANAVAAARGNKGMEELSLLKETHAKLQATHQDLQQSHARLHQEHRRQHEELAALQKLQEEMSALQLRDETLRIQQQKLEEELFKERTEKEKVKQELEAALAASHIANITSAHSDSHGPDLSDCASPESVTSFEFYRPEYSSGLSASKKGMRGEDGRVLSPLHHLGTSQYIRQGKEKQTTPTQMKEANKKAGSRVGNTVWNEDKENLHTTTTTLTVTEVRKVLRQQSEISDYLSDPTCDESEDPLIPGRQVRRGGSAPGYSGAAQQQLFLTEDLLSLHHDVEGDGVTTSGESPDLGIGSDNPCSSLERRTLRTFVNANRHHTTTALCTDPSQDLLLNQVAITHRARWLAHSALDAENRRLRVERNDLTRKLQSTKDTLQDALSQLSKANQRKEKMEKAICKELTKTHHVLKKTNKGNLKAASRMSN